MNDSSKFLYCLYDQYATQLCVKIHMYTIPQYIISASVQHEIKAFLETGSEMPTIPFNDIATYKLL